MAGQDFNARFRAAIDEVVGTDRLPADIDPNQSLEALGLDSLDVTEVLATLEDKFDVRLMDNDTLGTNPTWGGLQQAVEAQAR